MYSTLSLIRSLANPADLCREINLINAVKTNAFSENLKIP